MTRPLPLSSCPVHREIALPTQGSMKRNRHQQEEWESFLQSLPAAPARIFVSLIYSLPRVEEEGREEVQRENRYSGTDRLLLLWHGRHLENIRCHGIVTKREEGAGFWLDDGSGLVQVLLGERVGKDLIPPLGQLCEVVGALRYAGKDTAIDASTGKQGQQMRNQEEDRRLTCARQRVVVAGHVFQPRDANAETAFMLSIISWLKKHSAAHSSSTSKALKTACLQSAPPRLREAASSFPRPNPPSTSGPSDVDSRIMDAILRHTDRETKRGMTPQALEAIAAPREVQASLSRLQVEGSVYEMHGAFFPL